MLHHYEIALLAFPCLNLCPSFSECQRDQFDSLPPNITYVPLGGDVNITCTHTTIPRNNLQVRRLPSTDVIQCTSNPMCTLDVDSGIFTLHNFQSNYNGTYQFDFFVEGFHRCYVNFDVIEAGKIKLYILHLCSKFIDSLLMYLVL